MNSVIDDCLVEDYEFLKATLSLPDEGDKHFLAAAIHSKSTIIVTANIKDFPAAELQKHGIKAMTADDFICSLVDEFGEEGAAGLGVIVNLVKSRLKNPPVLWSQYLHTLETLSGNALPNTVARIREIITAAETTTES
jgi:hypothetical protein